MYFCDVYVVCMWCSCSIHMIFYILFMMFTYYTWDAPRILGCSYIINACSTIIFEFSWDDLWYILNCLSNIHVIIFLTYLYYVDFSFSVVTCSMLLLCYFFSMWYFCPGYIMYQNSYSILFFFFCFALNFIIFIYVMVFIFTVSIYL
jgi:hypothetical protein